MKPEQVGEVVAIVLAAGRSTRMTIGDKLWFEVAGRPLIAHSLRTLAALDELATLVVVAAPERHGQLADLVPCGTAVCYVAGGERRRDSVAAGIAAAPNADWYLVHDGARPLLTLELTRRVLAGARRSGAAVPVTSVADTLKRVDESGLVVETVDRAPMRQAQTPQAFAGELLRRAHAGVLADATDDAALVEALGEPVVVVEGDPANLKVTLPQDVELARALLDLRQSDSAEARH